MHESKYGYFLDFLLVCTFQVRNTRCQFSWLCIDINSLITATVPLIFVLAETVTETKGTNLVTRWWQVLLEKIISSFSLWVYN